MPIRRSRSPLLLIVILLVGGFLLLAGPTALAHGRLQSSIPAEGQVAGGEIDRLQLVFTTVVTEPNVRVVDPAGELLDTIDISTDENVVDVEIEPATMAGEHRVVYQAVSSDGDLVDGAYLFTFEPGAAGLDFPDEGGGSPVIFWIGIALLVAGGGAMVWWLAGGKKPSRSGSGRKR